MDVIRKLSVQIRSIEHERTSSIARNMGYGFQGRSWGAHSKRVRRIRLYCANGVA